MNGDGISEVSSVQPTTNAETSHLDGSVTTDSDGEGFGGCESSVASSSEHEDGWVLKSAVKKAKRRSKSRSRSPRPKVRKEVLPEPEPEPEPGPTDAADAAPAVEALPSTRISTTLFKDDALPAPPPEQHEWTQQEVKPTLREDHWPPLPAGAGSAAGTSSTRGSAQRDRAPPRDVKTAPGRVPSPATPRRVGSVASVSRTRTPTDTGSPAASRYRQPTQAALHRRRHESPGVAGARSRSAQHTPPPQVRRPAPGRCAPPPPSRTPRADLRRGVVGSATVLRTGSSPAAARTHTPPNPRTHSPATTRTHSPATTRTQSPATRTKSPFTVRRSPSAALLRTNSPGSPAARKVGAFSSVRRVPAGGLPQNVDVRLDTANLRKLGAARPTPAAARGARAAYRSNTPQKSHGTPPLADQPTPTVPAATPDVETDAVLGDYPAGLLEPPDGDDERVDARVVSTVCGVPAHSHMVRYAHTAPDEPRRQQVGSPVEERASPTLQAASKPQIPLVVSPQGRYAVTSPEHYATSPEVRDRDVPPVEDPSPAPSPEQLGTAPQRIVVVEKRHLSPPRAIDTDAASDTRDGPESPFGSPTSGVHPLPAFQRPHDPPAGPRGGLYAAADALLNIIGAAQEHDAGPVPPVLQLQVVETLTRVSLCRDETQSCYRMSQDFFRAGTAVARRGNPAARQATAAVVQREKGLLQAECERKLQALRADHDQHVYLEEMRLAELGDAPEVDDRRAELRRACALHYAKLASLRAQYGARQSALGSGLVVPLPEAEYNHTLDQLDHKAQLLEEALDALLEIPAVPSPRPAAELEVVAAALMPTLLRLHEDENDSRRGVLEAEACAMAKLLSAMHAELLQLMLRPRRALPHAPPPPPPRPTVSASPAADFILSPSVDPEGSERAKSASNPPVRPPPPVPSCSPSPPRQARGRASPRGSSPQHGVRDLRGKTPPHLMHARYSPSASRTPVSISPSPGAEGDYAHGSPAGRSATPPQTSYHYRQPYPSLSASPARPPVSEREPVPDEDAPAGRSATPAEDHVEVSEAGTSPAQPQRGSRTTSWQWAEQRVKEAKEAGRGPHSAKTVRAPARKAVRPPVRGGEDQPPEFAAYAIDGGFLGGEPQSGLARYDAYRSGQEAAPPAAEVEEATPSADGAPKWKQLVDQLHRSSLGPVREIFERLQSTQQQSRTEQRSKVLDELKRELRQAARDTFTTPTVASADDLIVRHYDTPSRRIGHYGNGGSPMRTRGGQQTQTHASPHASPARSHGYTPHASPARSYASRGGGAAGSPRREHAAAAPVVWKTGCGATGYASRSPSPPVHRAPFVSAFPER